MPPSEAGQDWTIRRFAIRCIFAIIAVLITMQALVLLNRPLALRIIGWSASLAIWAAGASDCPIAETMGTVQSPVALTSATAQIASDISLQKTEAGLDLWNTPQGSIWTVHGEKILPFLIFEQQHDIYEPAGHAVHPGDIVLDCGANIGMFTKKALSRGARLVVAIEPAPDTVKALRRNLEGEIRAGRVIVYPKGVWDRDDELELTLNETNQGANSLVIGREISRKVRVPLTTIDKIVGELHLPRVDFIKMDIEGSEKRAVTGGRNTIAQFRPRMSISSEHLPDDITAVPALVETIEPRYTHRACDCVKEGRRIKALVLAFDPA